MDEVGRALKLYLGRPKAAWPQSRGGDVERAHSAAILSTVEALLEEIGAIPIDWTEHDLRSAMQ